MLGIMASKARKDEFNGRALYRFFDTAEHAEALTQGQAWISTLGACRRCSKGGKKAAEIVAVARPKPHGVPKSPR
jgi:hypothetical protein